MRSLGCQVENSGIQNGVDFFDFASGRGSGQGKNARTDDRADSEGGQAPRPECFLETMQRLFRRGNQNIDALRAKKLVGLDGGGHVLGKHPSYSVRRVSHNCRFSPAANPEFD